MGLVLPDTAGTGRAAALVFTLGFPVALLGGGGGLPADVGCTGTPWTRGCARGATYTPGAEIWVTCGCI